MAAKKKLAVVTTRHDHFQWFKRENEHLGYAFFHVRDQRDLFRQQFDEYVFYSVMPKFWFRILGELEHMKVPAAEQSKFKV